MPVRQHCVQTSNTLFQNFFENLVSYFALIFNAPWSKLCRWEIRTVSNDWELSVVLCYLEWKCAWTIENMWSFLATKFQNMEFRNLGSFWKNLEILPKSWKPDFSNPLDILFDKIFHFENEKIFFRRILKILKKSENHWREIRFFLWKKNDFREILKNFRKNIFSFSKWIFLLKKNELGKNSNYHIDLKFCQESISGNDKDNRRLWAGFPSTPKKGAIFL